MRAHANALRARSADLLLEHPTLLRAYSSLHGLGSIVYKWFGRDVDSLRHALRALRPIGVDAAPDRAREHLRSLLNDLVFSADDLVSIAENPVLIEFQDSPEAQRIRHTFGSFPLEDRVRIRFPTSETDPERQGDLIVLKDHDAESGERGVLLVKYTESVRRLAALFDVQRLVADYAIVLEPSWWGYEDETFFLFIGRDAEILVQAPFAPDFQFVSWLGSNLTPIPIGAGDWVDPALGGTPASGPRTHDIVMVSSWNPFKRHELLVREIPELEKRLGRQLRIALVGYEGSWTRADIERLLERYGVRDRCTVHDGIPFTEVSRIVADSRVYLLLSKREGANKGMYEAMFCNTPVVVPIDHRGLNHSHVNAETGVRFGEGRLVDALESAIRGHGRFQPRAWALQNTGHSNSTRSLNRWLRSSAESRGHFWSRDIVAKTNAPNLRYLDSQTRQGMDRAYDRLKAFLLAT